MRRLCFAVSIFIAAADQLLKWASERWFQGGIDFIPNVLYLTYTKNPGASLGMLADYPWALVAVSAVASIVMVFAIIGIIRGITDAEKFAISLILGGAVGNLIDRLGPEHKVIDMLYFPWISKIPLLPDFICNFADIAVTFGVIAFLILYAKRELATPSKAESQAADE